MQRPRTPSRQANAKTLTVMMQEQLDAINEEIRYGTPLQYSCLENPMDGGAGKAGVHGVTEGRTRLSD